MSGGHARFYLFLSLKCERILKYHCNLVVCHVFGKA